MFNSKRIAVLEEQVDFLASKVRALADLNKQLISIMEMQGASINNLIGISANLTHKAYPVTGEYPNTPNGT